MLPMSGFRGWPGLKTAVDAVKTTLDGVAAPLLNIASAALGVIFLIGVIRNVAREQRGDPGSQDSMLRTGITVIGSILILQLIRILFFN